MSTSSPVPTAIEKPAQDQGAMRPSVQEQVLLFLGVFAGCVWIHQPWRYYFFGDDWVLLQLVTDPKTIFLPHNEHFIPLFKAFYLLEYALFGAHHLAYMLVLLATHAGGALMVYRLGLRLSLRPWSSVAAALIFAFSSVHWEVTAWAMAQVFTVGGLFMLLAVEQFLSHPPGTKSLFWLATLSLVALLTGGPTFAFLAVFLTAYCLLRMYRGEEGFRKTGQILLALWLPVVLYLILAKVAVHFMPGSPSPIPHFHLRDTSALLDYALFGTVYGVVLRGLTFLDPQTAGSISVILILLAALIALAYKRLAPDRRTAFWFLVMFLFAPLLVISVGRLQVGVLYSMSPRYSYLPTIPFALLLVLLWEAFQSNGAPARQRTWQNALALLLLGYYFAFHFAVLRRQNLQAIRGELAQQFMAIAKKATYPDTIQSGSLVLGPDLRVPDYVCSPAFFYLWQALQLLEGDFHRIVSVSEYLKNANSSLPGNLLRNGGFETADSMDQWKTNGTASAERTPSAARDGNFGAMVNLEPAGSFSREVINSCPASLPRTIFTFAIASKANGDAPLSARVVFKNSAGSILETVPSLARPGDSEWHQLVVSALTPAGTCAVGVDLANTGQKQVTAALDEAIFVAHPGTVASDGQLSFRRIEDILPATR